MQNEKKGWSQRAFKESYRRLSHSVAKKTALETFLADVPEITGWKPDANEIQTLRSYLQTSLDSKKVNSLKEVLSFAKSVHKIDTGEP